MGGQKRKISMEKIEKKEKRWVAFSKRRKGLFRKASELCLQFDVRIAVLATPPSSNSHVSFYSFGHSSVDDVVDAFLENRGPSTTNDHLMKGSVDGRKNGCLAKKEGAQGLGFWWEDEALERSDNTKDLKDAIDEIQKLKNNVNNRLMMVKDHEDSFAGLLKDIDFFLNEVEQDPNQDPLAVENFTRTLGASILQG